MMYENKLVAALKVNGKVLRESKDTVFIPFGAEYQIHLHNLNTVRALVHITIDGTEVCPDGFVLDANRKVDLERFIKDGNLTSGNRFKFIERTASVENHRGIKAEDGIIRISFSYEKQRPYSNLLFVGNTEHCPSPPPWPGSSPWPGYFPPGVRGNEWYNTTAVGQMHDSNVKTKGIARGATLGTTSVNCATGVAQASYSAPVNDVGITVPGSVSNQTFSTTTMGVMETEEHVIVLRILGETAEGREVQKPVTVKSKPTCITCGRVNKASSKFCSNCGTSLTII